MRSSTTLSKRLTGETTKATIQGLHVLMVQGFELLLHLIVVSMKTHITIMLMIKCFSDKLKKQSKNIIDLNKIVFAKNTFNAQLQQEQEHH
jgi:hypothetical protein